MNSPVQQAYEWGVFRKSTKRIWVGLTRREMQLIVALIAFQNPHDWLLWHRTWPEWQELAESLKHTDYEALKPNMKDLHVNPPNQGVR